MARQVKCPKCNKLNNKEDTETINNRYYCKTCAEEVQAEKDTNKSDWDLLFDYICKIYNISKPSGMMFKQLKEFRNEPYNYTNSGMYATLRYYHETLGNDVLEGAGLGIIPYYYEKTKQHYLNISKVEESLEVYQPSEDKHVKVDLSYRNKLIKAQQKVLNYDDIDWSESDE